jgi:hypothetical protein
MTTYQEMTETARSKFSTYTHAQCDYAIKDIHRALDVTCSGKDHRDPYVQKLWSELDAARDRVRELGLAMA